MSWPMHVARRSPGSGGSAETPSCNFTTLSHSYKLMVFRSRWKLSIPQMVMAKHKLVIVTLTHRIKSSSWQRLMLSHMCLHNDLSFLKHLSVAMINPNIPTHYGELSICRFNFTHEWYFLPMVNPTVKRSDYFLEIVVSSASSAPIYIFIFIFKSHI